ncbi:hypothetical protein [Aquitalea sp.]|nr:hypothetical protein [Aquitalea sp.]
MQKTLLVLAMLTLPLASIAMIELAFAAPPSAEAEADPQAPQASVPQAVLPDAAAAQDSSMPQPAGQQ